MSSKSKVVALLLCLFLGLLGVHRFYVGKTGTGLLQFFTGGGLGIWTVIDFIMVLTGGFTTRKGANCRRSGPQEISALNIFASARALSGPMNRFKRCAARGMTRALAAVAGGRAAPDLVITGARILSTYSERILPGKEIWICQGRIAAVKTAGDCKSLGCARTTRRAGSSRRVWWTRTCTSRAA